MKYHELDNVKWLPNNYIFVFWSNESWRHWKWAALIAKNNFGAIYY